MEYDQFLISALTYLAVNSWYDIIETYIDKLIPQRKDNELLKLLFAIAISVIVVFLIKYYKTKKTEIIKKTEEN